MGLLFDWSFLHNRVHHHHPLDVHLHRPILQNIAIAQSKTTITKPKEGLFHLTGVVVAIPQIYQDVFLLVNIGIIALFSKTKMMSMYEEFIYHQIVDLNLEK